MVKRIYDYDKGVTVFIATSSEGYPSAKDGDTLFQPDTTKKFVYYGDWYDPYGKRVGAEIKSLSMTISDVTYDGVIAVGDITVTVPTGTDVSAVLPTITVSPGATVSPATAQDFSSDPVTYTVTAEDETTTNTYSVEVVFDDPEE